MEKEQIYAITANMWDPLFDMIWGIIGDVLTWFLVAVFVVAVLFLLCSGINPFRLSPEYLARKKLKFFPYDLLRWWLYDALVARHAEKVFAPFGFTLFVGPQGAGKTMSLVYYCLEMKKRYPKCLLYTNFVCSFADGRISDWHDFLELRNGTDGIIFAFDEIHAEYNSSGWQDFPEELLAQISMQRKQRIKIVATSQMFSRVAKPIREQTFSVVLCRTWFGRLTGCWEFETEKFNVVGDSSYSLRKGSKPIWKRWFVQSNELRDMFDTYEVIERMKKLEYPTREKRRGA